MKGFFQSNFVTVFILFVGAMVVSIAAYPELFVSFNIGFVRWSDYCVEYTLTFILTTFFYQGGLQLWNHFGQMPFFHTYAAEGMFKFPNVIAAVTYYVLAPFLGHTSRLFHHAFAWGNMMTLLFIRVSGIFLLLKIVTRNRIILTVGTVIFAIFFSQPAFLLGGFYMSYFPLGMYFIVRFFEGLEWRYLIAICLFLIISLGNGIHYGGYMYLPLHFFIIAGILWRVFFSPRTHSPKRRFWEAWAWKDLVGVTLLALFILGPYFYIIKFGFPDLALGQDNNRLSHPFSPAWYFHNLDLVLGNPRTFFSDTLNMQTMDPFFYIGWSFYFLAWSGFILSRDRLKWFLGLGIFFLWLLSFPREGVNLGLIAHWVNALTNPLKSIPRSYQIACQSMLPYVLMPLAVMGIEAIYKLYRGEKYPRMVLGAWGALTLVFTLANIPVLPNGAKAYLVLSAFLATMGIAWICFRDSPRARHFLASAVCFLVFMDIIFIYHQTKIQFATSERRPIVFDASPQSGMVGYDFENPSIFPYRYSYIVNFSYRDVNYLWVLQGVTSVMYTVMNQGLAFTYLNSYNPRHVEFAKWANDPSMLSYLTQNNEFLFLAPTAINASADALGRISSAGLARQVVEVEDPGRVLDLPDRWPDGIASSGQENFQYNQISGRLDDINDPSEYHSQEDMIVYTLHLPADFPKHLSSSWFLPEGRYLRFLIETEAGKWQELQAAQGELIRPYTFDVQNVMKGDLNAAFPKNNYPMYRRYVLLYPSSENQGVEGLWRRQFDNLGIIYHAKREGWLVSHYPYDKKWKISVDGKPVAYYRVNKSFIGFPLAQGEHKILFQYWPQSPLRILLSMSLLLTTLGLPMLFFIALKWEGKLD